MGPREVGNGTQTRILIFKISSSVEQFVGVLVSLLIMEFWQTVGSHLTVGHNDYLPFAKNNPLLLQCLHRTYQAILKRRLH